jgi:hypothetical protein
MNEEHTLSWAMVLGLVFSLGLLFFFASYVGGISNAVTYDGSHTQFEGKWYDEYYMYGYKGLVPHTVTMMRNTTTGDTVYVRWYSTRTLTREDFENETSDKNVTTMGPMYTPPWLWQDY